jgi:hypothetical protein
MQQDDLLLPLDLAVHDVKCLAVNVAEVVTSPRVHQVFWLHAPTSPALAPHQYPAVEPQNKQLNAT